MSGPIKLNQPISTHRPPITTGSQISQNYDQKMRDVAKLYETQFLREMHKAMKGTIHKSEFIKEGMAEKIFQEKLDHHYIDQWAGKGGIGLADIIYQQLKERVMGMTRGYVPAPQGPLPLDKGTTLKVDKTTDDLHKMPAPSEEQNSEGEVSFLLKPPRSLGENTPKVTAPWSGQIRQFAHLASGEQVLRIQHDKDLFSLLSFQGRSSVKEGDWVEAGQKLGDITDSSQALAWKVSQTRGSFG
ncbi:MAG: rod-binding protein [Bdellovibrionales bacterium]|nr:rod-binding protein [Bdellovibrionales bacterium]